MTFQQYFMQERKPIPSSVATSTEKATACFDCNICLDFARDPVVTLCGHLYCWPCICKWVDSQSASLPSGQLPQCPVCKAETSEKALVPLYGRGQSLTEPQNEETAIPPRPPASGIQGLADLFNPGVHLTDRDLHQNSRYFPNHNYNNEGRSESPLSNIRGIALLVLSHPVVEMLGRMIHARAFGNSTSLYVSPNSYSSMGSTTPRLRRHELQADKSLNRVTIFLFCCLILCLLLF